MSSDTRICLLCKLSALSCKGGKSDSEYTWQTLCMSRCIETEEVRMDVADFVCVEVCRN